MGASIIPITIYKGKLYFLFGKEQRTDTNPGWADFGGGTDKGETFMDTACREGSEELTGFLGTKTDIRKHLQKQGKKQYFVEHKSDGFPTYRCHMYPIEYDGNLPVYFNRNQQIIREHLGAATMRTYKIFEKSEIRWFSVADLRREKKIFRTFYQNIIGQLLEQERDICAFARRNLHKGGKSTRRKVVGRKNMTRRR